MALNVGQIVKQRYRIARLLGQGGMGAVYRAWDLTLNIPVALKEMLPDPSLQTYELVELRQQFRQEAQVLAGLVHPNLPRVTDFFEWQGKAYLVMDFIEGESLESIINRRGALPEQEVFRWALQLLDALAACHERQILHRDIKPQNIIIRSDGRAVLVDFGLVKLWDPHKPQTQRIIRGMGTREYASPEQFGMRGMHTEPRSDIYSLGATLYHALVGRVPSSALDRLAETGPLVAPRTLGIRINPHVEQVILRALSLDKGQRYANVQEMKGAFQRILDSREMQEATVPAYQQPRRPQPQLYPQPQPRPRPDPQPARAARWALELGTALALAITGVIGLQVLLFADQTPFAQYIGLSIGALVLGALGWFIGDTIYQALTLPSVSTTPDRTAKLPGNRPTQRLVVSTRKLMRRLTTAQQIGMLVALVTAAALAAWGLGPLIAEFPFLWNNLPFYALVAPLVYAAVGRRPGRAGIAHALVVVIGGMALKASVATTTEFGPLLLASVGSGALIEGVAFLSERSLFRH